MGLRIVVRSIAWRTHGPWCIAVLTLLAACAVVQDGAQADAGQDWRTAADDGSGTLVRGRITADTLVLEPLLVLPQMPATPLRNDQHRLLGFGEEGDTLVDVRFDGEPVAAAGGDPGEHHFSFAIDTPGGALQAVEIHLADGRFLRREASLSSREMLDALAVPGAMAVERDTAGRALVRWDASRFPAIAILDPGSGRILTFARGGEIQVSTDEEAIDIVVSEGVRSMRRRFPVAP